MREACNLILIAVGSPCREMMCSDLSFKKITSVTQGKECKSENPKAVYETYCSHPGERWDGHALVWYQEDARK